MLIGKYVASYRASVDTALSFADESTRALAHKILDVVQANFRLSLLDLVHDVANRVEQQLPDGVDVRAQSSRDDIDVIVTSKMTVTQEELPADEAADEDMTARLTLRLPQALKEEIEQEAARRSMSLNAYLVQLIRENLKTRRRRGGISRPVGISIEGWI
ncbi:hypothetical protein [Trueperella sp. LYQ143]|uniref:hypothetical protein n=1 Tax=unclassified Trueperella TaxID=2630174 RepID=UPI00398308ED